MTTGAAEAAELAEWAGGADLALEPWQMRILEGALGRRRNGRWSATEVAVVVPRQNGKGGVLEARELLGLFLIGESIVHSAHLMDTSKKAHDRFWKMVKRTPELIAEVAAHHANNNELSVELRSGARIEWVTRSQDSARGWTEDVVILDEAFALTADQLGAILPVVAARPNWQVIYTSSAGHTGSSALRQVRTRGTAGEARLAYYEWSIDPEWYRSGPETVAADPQAWAQANPTLGIRIERETVEVLQRSMPPAEFAREFLGIWDDERSTAVIPLNLWDRLAADPDDPGSQLTGPVVAAIDAAPDDLAASIGVCGRRLDGLPQVEVVVNRPGTSWVVKAAVAMRELNPEIVAWLVDPSGPAGALIPGMEAAGIELKQVTTREMAQACGALRADAVAVTADQQLDLPEYHPGGFRHLAQPELTAALVAARRRNVGDGAWAWARRTTDDDISPLVAVTLARHGLAVHCDEDKGTTNLW